MKKAFLTVAILSLFLLPAIAGEGHEHAEKASKCGADAQACLNHFADAYRNRGWAGVQLDHHDLSVTEVHPGTPAAHAGVKVGDVLLAVNGIEYNKPENKEKMKALQVKMVPGNEFTYTISRKGKKKDVSIALAEMPMDVVATMVGMHMLTDHSAVEIAQADD